MLTYALRILLKKPTIARIHGEVVYLDPLNDLRNYKQPFLLNSETNSLTFNIK